jgi:hypothetical protein
MLNAVEPLARNDVWVAGARPVGESDMETYLAHWDGSAWEVSASGTGHPGWLKSLAAADSNDIWAAGDTNFLHWNGTTWQEVPKGFTGGQLRSITRTVGSRVLWAVGQRGRKTLMMRYCG